MMVRYISDKLNPRQQPQGSKISDNFISTGSVTPLRVTYPFSRYSSGDRPHELIPAYSKEALVPEAFFGGIC